MYPVLLTPEQAAKMLNTSKDRVYRMSRDGLLPVVKLGRLVRFNREQLERWIEAGGQGFDGGWRKNEPQTVAQ